MNIDRYNKFSQDWNENKSNEGTSCNLSKNTTTTYLSRVSGFFQV